MRKIAVVGLVVLALIVGFLFIQNAGAFGTMMGRGSWWQPSSTWHWGAYCPWNYRGSRSTDYRGDQRGSGWGGGWMMNQGWGAGYRGYPDTSENPQGPQQSPGER